MEFQVRGDDGGGEFGVGGGAGSRAPYLRSDVVKFLAILQTRGRSDFYDLWVLVRLDSFPTLSATMGPEVALVSAAITTPPSKIHPTIVVPVLVALGNGTPWACRAAFRL